MTDTASNVDTEELDFVLETTSLSEITSDIEYWNGNDVKSIGKEAIAEITKGDEKPFFVDFVGIYEGVSGNNRKYTKEAVESCVQAMVGVNMYKGHQEPGTSDWKYREPVGKIVASRLSTIEVDGHRVLAAKGKAYITEADTKLRSDIGRRMAGPLSVLGSARAVREFGSPQKTITLIHKPLTSIDFCNPGTNGMPAAGVTAIVREMSSKEPDTVVKQPKEPEMDKKLTKEQLLAEYGDEISTIVGEQVKSRFDDLAKEKASLEESKQEVKQQKEGFETKISEMETKNKDLTEKLEEANNKIKEADQKLLKADLDKFATDLVKEMGESDDHEEKVVTVAADGLEPSLVDGDLEASKTAFKTKLTSAVERAEKLVEMVGGKIIEEGDEKTRIHKKNPKAGKKDKGPNINRFLSPELLEAGKDNK